MVYKVVIIDDEFVIRDGMTSMIKWQRYGCEVVGTADNGKEGEALIKKLNPHIIFTDICMPIYDGLEMLSNLKEEISDKEVTIMTGFGEFDYARKAIKLGVTRYLMKPSQMDEIEEAIFSMVENLNKRLGHVSYQTDNFQVNLVLKEIEEHYREKLTLADISEKNEISVWHLSKLINKCCNKTFKDLLNETRIHKAQKLLLETNLKVYEISDLVGITDVTYFSRLFKKHSDGLLPNEYRNKTH